MVGQSNIAKSIRISRTAAGFALGVGLALAVAPALAQSEPVSAGASPSPATGTAQPPLASDLDTDFWVLVRDSADPNALQSYLSSFPSGKFTNEARQKLAALRKLEKGEEMAPTPSTSPPPQIAPAAPAENRELARALQRELKRVGCLDAEADGVWGDKSRSALKAFARHANLSVGGEEPNVALLDAAQSRKSRVCPLVCGEDERAVGERCVPNIANKPRQARQRPAQEERRAQPRQRGWAERPAAERAPSGNSGKRICFGSGRTEIVACP
jgi:peptidoglycan hydrolase-like protein with peptidoglycan-binding domain